MEFTINRSYFLDKLNAVARAISPHSPLPVLSGLLIQVKSDQIVLTGSDNSMIITTVMTPGELSQLQIQEPGDAVLEARYLIEVIRRMSGEQIHFETLDEKVAQVSNSSGKFQLVLIQGQQYPPLDLSRPETELTVPLALLKDISEQISYAASEKESRQVLMGINFNAEDGKLYASATDSYRMARKIADLDSRENFSITVPAKGLLEVIRALDSEGENVEIFLNRRKAQFISGKTTVQLQLYDGTFPDVSKIIPQKFIATLEVDSSSLTPILERAILFKSSSVAEVRFELSESVIRITCESRDIGSSDQILDESFYQGEPLRLSINGQYILDAIKGLKTDGKIRMGFTGTLKPIRITKEDDDSLVMVVVPMKSSH